MEERVIRSIRRACAAGLDSVALRRELMRRIAPVVPHDAYAFSTCDPDTGLMAHTVAENVPGALGRTYVERLFPDETALRILDTAHTGGSVTAIYEMSHAVRDEFAIYGLNAPVHLMLVSDGRLRGTCCVMRDKRSSSEIERAQAFFGRAAPVIARALKSASAIDEAKAAGVSEGSVTTPGVVVLDAASRPLVRTPAAKRWLRDLADVGITEPDDIPLSVLSLASRLRRTPTDVPEEIMLRLRGASGRWYTVRGSLAEPDDAGRATTVMVIRPAVRREVASVLTQLYGLSKREREVVASVARGESTKCIAAVLGLSPHTVEEHLERACRKIGVRGRKALVAKIFVDGYAPSLGAAQPGQRSTFG